MPEGLLTLKPRTPPHPPGYSKSATTATCKGATSHCYSFASIPSTAFTCHLMHKLTSSHNVPSAHCPSKVHFHSICQSKGGIPAHASNSLAWLKCVHLKLIRHHSICSHALCHHSFCQAHPLLDLPVHRGHSLTRQQVIRLAEVLASDKRFATGSSQGRGVGRLEDVVAACIHELLLLLCVRVCVCAQVRNLRLLCQRKSVRACVCACVRARMCVCVCACACSHNLQQPFSQTTRHPPPPSPVLAFPTAKTPRPCSSCSQLRLQRQ